MPRRPAIQIKQGPSLIMFQTPEQIDNRWIKGGKNMSLAPARDEVVLTVWENDQTTARPMRYCCPPSGDRNAAVWRELDELHGPAAKGTLDWPYAWRPLTQSERRLLMVHKLSFQQRVTCGTFMIDISINPMLGAIRQHIREHMDVISESRNGTLLEIRY